MTATRDKLTRLADLSSEAEPAPWTASEPHETDGWIRIETPTVDLRLVDADVEDAALIVAARNALPALVDLADGLLELANTKRSFKDPNAQWVHADEIEHRIVLALQEVHVP